MNPYGSTDDSNFEIPFIMSETETGVMTVSFNAFTNEQTWYLGESQFGVLKDSKSEQRLSKPGKLRIDT